MDCTNYKNEIDHIKQLFSKAESICKRVESDPGHEGGVVIPAINQLRYAGQHLITACSSDDVHIQKSELTKALNHCQRAVYDATEAACLIVKIQIDIFKEQFREIIIADVVPSYSDTLRAHASLKKAIGNPRSDESKQEHYESLLDVFDTLNSGLEDLEAHEEELKKALVRHRSEEEDRAIARAVGTKSLGVAKKTLLFTVVATIFAVLSVGIAYKALNTDEQGSEGKSNTSALKAE